MEKLQEISYPQEQDKPEKLLATPAHIVELTHAEALWGESYEDAWDMKINPIEGCKEKQGEFQF